MINEKDKLEIFEQYKFGYAYTEEQIIRWYNATPKEAEQIIKEGKKVREQNSR